MDRENMTEHTIQNLAVAMIRKIGFTVHVTSNRKKTANTKGIPDTSVHIRGTKWIKIEFKQPRGKISEEQEKLQKEGMIYIVDNVEDAIRICLKERQAK
jgi:hypothetical protein